MSPAGHASAVVGSDDVAGDSGDKATVESIIGDGLGHVSELHGTGGRSGANELEGSVGEGRKELA